VCPESIELIIVVQCNDLFPPGHSVLERNVGGGCWYLVKTKSRSWACMRRWIAWDNTPIEKDTEKRKMFSKVGWECTIRSTRISCWLSPRTKTQARTKTRDDEDSRTASQID
jgi:hypothetical protein